MNAPLFDLKDLRKMFYITLSINAIATIAAYIAGSNVAAIVLFPTGSRSIISLLMTLLVGVAISQTAFTKKKLEKLQTFTGFEDKVGYYKKIYQVRMYWKLLSCLSSCCFHIISGRSMFLYFAVFDVLTTWVYLPNKHVIRKEFDMEEIEFV